MSLKQNQYPWHPIKPMLAEASEPFDSEKHLFEIKWDGARCISFVNDGQMLQNRRLIDITKRYPEIKIQIQAKQAVLDGEIVVMEESRPRFDLLQQREHIEDVFRIKLLSESIPASLIVFDILYLDNKEITHLPLLERKRILSQILIENEHVFLCDYILKEGKKYFNEATKRGLEGVIAKDIESPYLTGKRSRYWLKIKKTASIDAIICGITEGEGEREKYFGALVLGCYENGELCYIGRVGTGLKTEDFPVIMKVLSGFEHTCPFKEIPAMEVKVKQWFKPEIVCQVYYNEITGDKKLRAPSFRGLRPDKPAEECII